MRHGSHSLAGERHEALQGIRDVREASVSAPSPVAHFSLLGTGLGRLQAEPGWREQEQPSQRQPVLSKLQVFLSPQHRSARRSANSIILDQVVTAIQHLLQEQPMLINGLLRSSNFCAGCRCPCLRSINQLTTCKYHDIPGSQMSFPLRKGNLCSAASSKPEAVAGLHH